MCLRCEAWAVSHFSPFLPQEVKGESGSVVTKKFKNFSGTMAWKKRNWVIQNLYFGNAKAAENERAARNERVRSLLMKYEVAEQVSTKLRDTLGHFCFGERPLAPAKARGGPRHASLSSTRRTPLSRLAGLGSHPFISIAAAPTRGNTT